MTSEEPLDGNKESNAQEKNETNQPKRSFRAEYARKTHNVVEKKRKDKIAFWIDKISGLLPKDPKKDSKNAILEKAFHYMVHLKEMNDKLIYGNADQITGEELRLARKRIKKLEDTNAVYYKLLKMSGITPNNIPLEVMNSDPIKNFKTKYESPNNDRNIHDPDTSDDGLTDDASDTTEVIRDEEIGNADLKSHTLTANLQPTSNFADKLNTNNLANTKIPLLVVNQNQDHNAPRISLSNGSQLQIRPSPNVQILGNGALAIDSSGFNQGPIILGSTLLSPPQPTTLVMHNGQLLSLVNQPQPAFVYTPGSGFVLTSSTPINSNSINVPTHQTQTEVQPQSKPQQQQQQQHQQPQSQPQQTQKLVKTSDPPEKRQRKARTSINVDQGASLLDPKVILKPKRTRAVQKASNNKQNSINTSEAEDENAQITTDQQSQQQSHQAEQEQDQQTSQIAPKKRGRQPKIPRKAKETSDKLTIAEVQNSGTAVETDKRPRLTTVIERVADSPLKRCTRTPNKANKVSTAGTDELVGTDLDTENYSFRQNSDASCEQDQLPLLLESLSEDHEVSTESVHSVSNSSLPTFLGLSPSDHLTDFLSKTSDHGNGTTRSPRYSSPINPINTNASNSQAPSVIISNQGTNIITEAQNCHDSENYTNSIEHHHHQQHHSESMDSNNYSANGSNNTGQGRLYSTDSQEDRRRPEISDKATSSQPVGRKSQETQAPSTTAQQQQSSGNTTLDSSAPTSSSTTNVTANQLLPYSAESLLRQQPQQSNTNNIPTSVPINSIYHVQSNVTVDTNIEFSNRGNSVNTSNNPSARPTISYSAERLIHTPPGENNHVTNNNRQKSHDTGKQAAIPGGNNNTTASNNNQTTNIYNEQYSLLRTSRGSNDLDPDLSRLQSSHHHQHHQHHQQQHSTAMYRSSPHEQRTNQDQHHSLRADNTNLNVNNQSNQTQIMHQQRNAYPESQHHQQQPPVPSTTQETSQQLRGQSHQTPHQPNQSSSQGQMKTTPASAAISSPTTNTNDNSNNNSGRELFNHHYPYGSSEGSTNERSSNNMNFNNSENGTNEVFTENNPSSSSQNNFLPPFPANSNCQTPFGLNNRRSTNPSTSMLPPFGFSDTSFLSDPYNRQAHGVSGNSSGTVVNFSDSNRRIGNAGQFVDHTTSTASANNPSNNYFMVHNHHVPSSLPNSNNPPIFSTSSSFPGLISSTANSNYDNNGYNLTCPSRSSASSSNITTTNISNTSNALANSNLHHHHHSHHHPTFYSDSGTSLQAMHNVRRPSDASYGASSNTVKSTANMTNNSTLKAINTSSTSNSKQPAKSAGGSSNKSTKKGSSATASKTRQPENSRSTNSINVSSSSIVTSYSSMTSFAPPAPPPPSASAVPNHSGNHRVSSSSSSSTLLNISSSTERSSVEVNESLFRPQSQSNASTNMQSTSSTSRSAGPPSAHGLSSVGHSSSFLPNFNYQLSNIFAEIQSINPNDNFTMSGLSAIKFNHPANVLPHHPSSNTPFPHSSSLQGSVQMDNSSGSMGDNSSHQNIYGHHSRIATPHHHNPFIPLIGSSPRTLKH